MINWINISEIKQVPFDHQVKRNRPGKTVLVSFEIQKIWIISNGVVKGSLKKHLALNNDKELIRILLNFGID